MPTYKTCQYPTKKDEIAMRVAASFEKFFILSFNFLIMQSNDTATI
jgi:hypothetical protein